MKKNIKLPASYYAAGTDIDDILENAKVPDFTTSVSTSNKSKSGTNKDNKLAAYLKAIVKLLTKEVENTALLSTVVTVLTELVKIYEEERNITGSNSTEIQQKKDAIESKRIAMLNVLKATGVQNNQGNELTKLIQDAERLAKM